MATLQIPQTSPIELSTYTNEHGVEISKFSVWDYNGELDNDVIKTPVKDLVITKIQKYNDQIRVYFHKQTATYVWFDAYYFNGVYFTQ